MDNFHITSFNAEGISQAKIEILSSLKADILCLQETHKVNPPTIPNFHLIVHHGDPVHGSAIYAKDKSIILNSANTSSNGIEILAIDTNHLKIISVYKPPPTAFNWKYPISQTDKTVVVVGDFNSHNTLWGYKENNADGEAVEQWAQTNNLSLIHNAKDKPSLCSARWKRGYNPDLVFVSSRFTQNFEKLMADPIPKSQHRPITISMRPLVQPIKTKPIPRFNFRKANWAGFTAELDTQIATFEPAPNNYEQFQKAVWTAAKKHIPRGHRNPYIPCLTNESKTVYEEYVKAYERDPFDTRTIQLGEELMSSISQEKSERWKELICNTDLTHNSKKAWKTIKKLNTENSNQSRVAAVTPNEVATQLILNGKPQHQTKGHLKEQKVQMKEIARDSDKNTEPFTVNELEAAMKHIKPGKAAGLDGITPEMILHSGIATRRWVLDLFNNCAMSFKIPKMWRQAKVVALLKPGKNPENRKSYRPISLLSILFKLYERLILARISQTVEEQLSRDQAGFRPGRSCCDQLLNLTQYIEDGYERKQITGAVFVDLSAAYDTVNHRTLLLKVARMVKNTQIVKIIESLLTNRRFYVEMDGKKSRWRRQKNGLPQGSVLAPTLFNMYTNDQPVFESMRRFIYADDLCLATQAQDFNIIEDRLTTSLSSLTEYYKDNSLNANPGKTQVCAFHLKNHHANKKLNISWNGKTLEHNANPIYLGVTLDRTLSFCQHIKKLKGKVSTRNNLLGKLANSKWGADPKTLRTTALALCYSSAEYCSPVWARSSHARKIDPELNVACRIITGTLKSTPIPTVYRLAGIAPPPIRRETQTKIQKNKQETDPRHSLYDHVNPKGRLKSRKSFMTTEGLPLDHAAIYRQESWKQWDTSPNNDAIHGPVEELPSGTSLPRTEWVTLNRARTKVGKTNKNMHRWGLSPTSSCECGYSDQTIEHLMSECELGPHCNNLDLRACNDNAITWIQHWRDKI